MGAIANEPSMEEILSSIKRIIADEDASSSGNGRGGRRRAAPRPAQTVEAEDDGDDDSVLELTESLPPEPAPESSPGSMSEPAPVPRTPLRPAALAPAPAPAPLSAPALAESAQDAVLSPHSAVAARESLSHLTAAVEQREAAHPGGQTIDGLVRELLTPMLKEWLDRHLPGMVEQMVQREIDRITNGLR